MKNCRGGREGVQGGGRYEGKMRAKQWSWRRKEESISNTHGSRETKRLKKEGRICWIVWSFPSLVEVTSYRYGISRSQRFCSGVARLHFDRQTDRMDPCHSQPQGSQASHNQSAINGVSGCGRILNVNCCKVLITPIDLLDNCNQWKQRYIIWD